MIEESSRDKVNETSVISTTQNVSSFIGVALLVSGLIMICLWAVGSDQRNGYLGGLNWNDKVINHNMLQKMYQMDI